VGAHRLPVSPYATVLPDGSRPFVCAFEVIKLWEIAPENVLQTQFIDLWPLAVLMRGNVPELVAQAERQILAAPIDGEKRVQLESELILFASLRVPARILAQILREDAMLKDIFKYSSLRELLLQELDHQVDQEKLDAAFAKGEKQGIRKGRKEGRKEGETKGEMKGQLALARSLSREAAIRHFGDLSAAARKRIAASKDVQRLQEAILDMASFADEAALLAFLDAPMPPSAAASHGSE
jgi:hypothetical protein